MNVDRPHHPVAGISDRKGADPAFLHQAHGVGRQRLRADRDRALGHGILDAHCLDIGTTLEYPAQIAVGEHTRERAIGALDRGHTHSLSGDLENGLRKPGTELNPRQGRIAAHHIVDQGEQFAAKRAPWVRAGKVIGTEAARIEQCHRQGVAQCKRSRCAGRGREIERTGFAIDRGIEMDISQPRER